MIVKIKQDEGWTFQECTRITTNTTEWGQRFTWSADIEWILQPFGNKKREETYVLKVIHLLNNDTPLHTIITDRTAYILNADGKTIDKIN